MFGTKDNENVNVNENETPRNKWEPSGMEMFIFLLAVLILTPLASFGGGYLAVHQAMAKTRSAILTATAAHPPVLPKPKTVAAVVPKATPKAKLIAANVVKNGKGIDHSLANQLAADPSIFSSPYCNNRKSARRRIKCNAYMASVQAGFVNKRAPAVQMLVGPSNKVSYVFEKDEHGKLQIVEYAVNGKLAPTSASNPSGGFTKIATFPVATTLAAASFIGPDGGTLTFHKDYMYMQVGG